MQEPSLQLPARRPLAELEFDNGYAALPSAFHTPLAPTPLKAPYLVCASASAAGLIGLDPENFKTAEFIESFTGNRPLPGSRPIAAVYSGHQFGVWAGQLGDGRAILLGDLAVDPHALIPGDVAGHRVPASSVAPGRLDVQLKGSGPTPYSRMGDGRAVLRSSIREFLCSEAMAGLGIATSRALCVTGSDQLVMRETPETTAVATRLAPSFVRFGSFEHWYYNDQPEQLKILADHVIARCYPQLLCEKNPYQALLAEVARRTARLVAQWQAVGFMHGVLNTDNMSILGLTLDYGPFGFMEAYDARHICNHTDQQGRYSYANQPRIGQWNCHALGQALLPLIGEVEQAQAALEVYQPEYGAAMNALLHAKLGLRADLPDDGVLFDAMFAIMQASHTDFTLFFRRLGELKLADPASDEPLRDLFIDRSAFDAWAVQYRQRLEREQSDDGARRLAMHAVNPKYVLRNYLAQVAIDRAREKDFSEVARLLAVLEQPFDEQPENHAYAALPPDWAAHLEVSCSS
ncbi:MAG: protein adenylyltransferase SelO [Janthinobacterium lividum]